MVWYDRFIGRRKISASESEQLQEAINFTASADAGPKWPEDKTRERATTTGRKQKPSAAFKEALRYEDIAPELLSQVAPGAEPLDADQDPKAAKRMRALIREAYKGLGHNDRVKVEAWAREAVGLTLPEELSHPDSPNAWRVMVDKEKQTWLGNNYPTPNSLTRQGIMAAMTAYGSATRDERAQMTETVRIASSLERMLGAVTGARQARAEIAEKEAFANAYTQQLDAVVIPPHELEAMLNAPYAPEPDTGHRTGRRVGRLALAAASVTALGALAVSLLVGGAARTNSTAPQFPTQPPGTSAPRTPGTPGTSSTPNTGASGNSPSDGNNKNSNKQQIPAAPATTHAAHPSPKPDPSATTPPAPVTTSPAPPTTTPPVTTPPTTTPPTTECPTPEPTSTTTPTPTGTPSPPGTQTPGDDCGPTTTPPPTTGTPSPTVTGTTPPAATATSDTATPTPGTTLRAAVKARPNGRTVGRS